MKLGDMREMVRVTRYVKRVNDSRGRVGEGPEQDNGVCFLMKVVVWFASWGLTHTYMHTRTHTTTVFTKEIRAVPLCTSAQWSHVSKR